MRAITADKRFFANRNALLVVLKNAQHIILVSAVLQLAMLALEAVVALVLVRRWSFVRRAYVDAVLDCWRLRGHIMQQRRWIATIRKRSDWWIAWNFLRLVPNRWTEFVKMLRRGVPNVTC